MVEIGTITTFAWAIFTAAFVVIIFSLSRFIAHMWIIHEEASPESIQASDGVLRRDLSIKIREDLVESTIASFVTIISLAILVISSQLDKLAILAFEIAMCIFAGILLYYEGKISLYFEGRKGGMKMKHKIIVVSLLLILITYQALETLVPFN